MSSQAAEVDPKDVSRIDSLDEEQADALRAAGIESIIDVRDAGIEGLAEVDEVDEDLAEEILEEAGEIDVEPDDEEGEEETEEQEGEVTETDEEGGSEGEQEGEAEQELESEQQGASEQEGESEQEAGAAADVDLTQIRDTAREMSQTYLEDPFDGVIEIGTEGDGWYAVVEVIERSSVPDTQDILGQYELDFDEEGSMTGYRLLDRYRRGDVKRTNSSGSRKHE